MGGYSYFSKIINFKNYGSNSSRQRTIVIVVRKNELNKITPFEIFPDFVREKTLKECIGDFPSLNQMNEYYERDPFHNFKEYDKKIRPWIHDLKPGQSAFENTQYFKKPHRIIDGKIHLYSNVFGDKYKRQLWSKVGPCIHTQNGCLASQNTIHPIDDRVFSISELMRLMTIPKSFKWFSKKNYNLPSNQLFSVIKKHELTIRESIGESVPTNIFYNIAKKIKKIYKTNESFFDICNGYENKNLNKFKTAAFYTSKINLNYLFLLLPDFKKNIDEINILEPSAGCGNFILPLIKKYQEYKKVNLFINDIDSNSINFIKNKLLKKIHIPKNVFIHFSTEDYLSLKIEKKIDLIIGNPPFLKVKGNHLYKNYVHAFWEKSISLCKNVILISPKAILSSPTYHLLREKMVKQNITNIVDFGELGFNGVKIETVAIKINNLIKTDKVFIWSIPKNFNISQYKNNIFNTKFPYWIIYWNKFFEEIFNSLKKNIFTIHKNYELSNKSYKTKKTNKTVWILRSKNISITSPKLIKIGKNYDKFALKSVAKKTRFYNVILNIEQDKLFLIPNLTYYPRVLKINKFDLLNLKFFINGSIILATTNCKITDKDIEYFYSDEFRKYYSIALNCSSRSLNVDKYSVFFYGIRR